MQHADTTYFGHFEQILVGRVGVVEVEVTTSHLVRHSLEVTEGVRYFERHCLETEGPDEVVDKDWSHNALGIFDIASPSIVFRKFDRDRFDGVVDVSIGDVDASIEDVVQDGGVEHSVMAESVETADALHDVEGAFVRDSWVFFPKVVGFFPIRILVHFAAF